MPCTSPAHPASRQSPIASFNTTPFPTIACLRFGRTFAPSWRLDASWRSAGLQSWPGSPRSRLVHSVLRKADTVRAYLLLPDLTTRSAAYLLAFAPRTSGERAGASGLQTCSMLLVEARLGKQTTARLGSAVLRLFRIHWLAGRNLIAAAALALLRECWLDSAGVAAHSARLLHSFVSTRRGSSLLAASRRCLEARNSSPLSLASRSRMIESACCSRHVYL